MVGIQLLTVLIVGLLTALALQCLLTTLGTAIALSSLRVANSPDGSDSSDISASAGVGILLTVNCVLFVACFLAIRFSQVETALSGAVAGLVIWAAYLLLVLWVGAIALRSVLGTLLNLTTGGLGRLIRVLRSAFQTDPPAPITEEQMMATIRQEIQSSLTDWQQQMTTQLQSLTSPETPQLPDVEVAVDGDPAHWQTVAAYLQTATPKSLTPKRLERKLQKLLPDGPLPALNRPELLQLLEQRSDLTPKQKHRILLQVVAAWTQQPAPSPTLGDRVQAVAEHPLTAKVAQIALAKTVDGLLSQGLPGPDSSLGTRLDQVIQRSMQEAGTLQQAAMDRFATLQQQTQQQLESTRQSAAAAAWWLFFIAATGGISAAVAGAWATTAYPLQVLHLLPLGHHAGMGP